MTFEYPKRRTWQDKEALRDYAYRIVDHLLDEAEKTDPELGNSAHQKDIKAFGALRNMGWLAEALVGWAADHQVGLAVEKRQFLPLSPQDAQKLPDYIAERLEVDDHRHELVGRDIRRYRPQLDPEICRLALVNLLRPGLGTIPMALGADLSDSLQALELGETRPILSPKKASRKVTLAQRRLQLRAVAFIAYRQALGAKQFDAIGDVASAYGVELDTVRGWEPRLRKEIGSIALNGTRAGARNLASHVAAARKIALKGGMADPASLRLGDQLNDESLAKTGKEYRASLGRSDEQTDDC